MLGACTDCGSDGAVPMGLYSYLTDLHDFDIYIVVYLCPDDHIRDFESPLNIALNVTPWAKA